MMPMYVDYVVCIVCYVLLYVYAVYIIISVYYVTPEQVLTRECSCANSARHSTCAHPYITLARCHHACTDLVMSRAQASKLLENAKLHFAASQYASMRRMMPDCSIPTPITSHDFTPHLMLLQCFAYTYLRDAIRTQTSYTLDGV